MRHLLLAAGVVLALGAPAAPAQDNDPHAIIDKALKALGGADKAKSFKAFTAKAKGSISAMDMNLDFTWESFTQPPHKSKTVVLLNFGGQELKIVSVFNSGKGWTSLNGDVKEADKEELDDHAEMEHIEAVEKLLTIKEDKAIKLTVLGDSKVGDAAVVGVEVTKKGQRDVKLYFDKKSNLLVKAEYRAKDPFTMQLVAQEKIFSDYKEMLPGYKVSSKQVVNNEGKRYMEVMLTEMQAVERHDDAMFQKPQ